MRRFGLSLLAALVLLTTTQMAAAKGGKKGVEKSKGPAPLASAKAIGELKGDYKWGMSTQAVLDKLYAKVDDLYKDRAEKARNDPAKTDQIRSEIKADKDRVAKSVVKFEGQKTGWDVSIVDEEFLQSNGESMLFSKEPKSKRYFFFSGGNLYKMFIAFDPEVVAGKSFVEFGEMMQKTYGKAQANYKEVNFKGVKDRYLDSYQWRSAQGDGLRLVDRSKFYDVYCLVIYDSSVEQRNADARKSQEAKQPKGSFVDGIITDKPADRDENDNVIDRITGKEVLKPGDRRGGQQNIKVPSPSGEMKSEDK
jgi:hypothetical protein